MKVYQINVVCGSGSTGRIAVDIAKEIEACGGSSRIAYGRGGAPDDVDSYKIETRWGVYWHVLMTRLTGKHGLYSRGATKRLVADIREYDPDIIHLHNIHGYYVNYEMLFRFLKEYNRPVVWTMHDCWAFTGQCAHYESVGCEQWRKNCTSSCPNLGGYPASRTSMNVANNYCSKRMVFSGVEDMTIVTPSSWLKNQLKGSFLKEFRVETIPNGIDLNVFKPYANSLREQLGVGNKKLILGVASVWTRNKGLNDFCKLAEILGEGYKVCLIGLNEKQVRSMPTGIMGIKRTESIVELAHLYSAADIYVNLTYEDTFPTTNIEALACGTPVITYRTGGSTEAVLEPCGAVVEKGDFTELKSVIDELCATPKEVEKCVARAKNFDKYVCYRRYIDLYNECVGE